MIIEGQRVSFCGDPDDNLDIGDSGRVMQAGYTGSHVKWATGNAQGQITLVSNLDLSVTSGPSDTDVLNAGLVGFSVQAVSAQGGSHAVLAALEAEGHLGSFQAIAEDCFRFVAERVRQDPSVAEVIAQLDPQDSDDLVYRASLVLLRDAVRQS